MMIFFLSEIESDDERSLYIPMLTELEENKDFIGKHKIL